MRRKRSLFGKLYFFCLKRKVQKGAVIEYRYFSGRKGSGSITDIFEEQYEEHYFCKMSTVAVLDDGKRIRFVDYYTILIESDVEGKVEKFTLDKVRVR